MKYHCVLSPSFSSLSFSVCVHMYLCTTSECISDPCDYSIETKMLISINRSALFWHVMCEQQQRTVREKLKQWHYCVSVSTADLGCFIQPSRCMCPLASLSCWLVELPLSRHRPSGRCSEQSLDMPHVAGRQGEHFGWHKAWHSEETKHCYRDWARPHRLLAPLHTPFVPSSA